jgi:hypothetical protein
MQTPYSDEQLNQIGDRLAVDLQLTRGPDVRGRKTYAVVGWGNKTGAGLVRILTSLMTDVKNGGFEL